MTASLARGQESITYDSVSLKGNYDRVWYSLANGEEARSAQAGWDLAFSTTGRGAGIRTNAATNTKRWVYPKGDTSDFGSNPDTAGMSIWRQLHNSDTSWAIGAFNANANHNNASDYGWPLQHDYTSRGG